MGSARSLDISTNLDETTIQEICKKTSFTRDEVIKWHQEFLVRINNLVKKN